jgi:uncharacterized membrane protein
MADDTVFVYLATYDSEDAAHEDWAAIQEEHSRGFIGTYDAAMVAKDAHGNVHVRKHEKPTQHGVAAGLAAGAVIGLLFPPALVGTALVGGAAGGLLGHFWRGMSRHDVKELGDFLDEGQAALVVVGRDEYSERIPLSMERARKRTHRAVKVDKAEFDDALHQATQHLGDD